MLGEILRKLLWYLGLLPEKGLYYVGGSDTLPPPLRGQEEQDMIARLEAGDEIAKSTLIERNLRLVVYIARRFENTGIGLEDLVSIGTIGLIKAVGTYRSDKKIKLATYASRCIENEILMYIRKIGAQKTEVSLDEPINTDWDGNELLLSDILWRTRWTGSCCGRPWDGCRSGRKALWSCALAWRGAGKRPRRRWRR